MYVVWEELLFNKTVQKCNTNFRNIYENIRLKSRIKGLSMNFYHNITEYTVHPVQLQYTVHPVQLQYTVHPVQLQYTVHPVQLHKQLFRCKNKWILIIIWRMNQKGWNFRIDKVKSFLHQKLMQYLVKSNIHYWKKNFLKNAFCN